MSIYFDGLWIIETTAITKQVQKRTHRKRRINKKWLKRYGYKTVPDDGNILVGLGCIYATPKAVERLKKALDTREAKREEQT